MTINVLINLKKHENSNVAQYHLSYLIFFRNQGNFFLKFPKFLIFFLTIRGSFNPLSPKPTEWSNTLKQFVGNLRFQTDYPTSFQIHCPLIIKDVKSNERGIIHGVCNGVLIFPQNKKSKTKKKQTGLPPALKCLPTPNPGILTPPKKTWKCEYKLLIKLIYQLNKKEIKTENQNKNKPYI